MEIQRGTYRHFKGGEYHVIGVATHSETGEQMVIYQALYGDHALWARPAAMWFQTVMYQGRQVPRFTYIGEEHKRRIFKFLVSQNALIPKRQSAFSRREASNISLLTW